MPQTRETYAVDVAGVKRELPLFEVKSGLKIAVLNILGDTDLVEAAARALAEDLASLDYDLLVTPALGERPLPIGECHGSGEHPLRDLNRSGVFTPYTSLFNLTGQPAVSVPVGLGADGLPVGIQIVGRPLAEDRLLQIARQLEYASPWAHLRPEPPPSGGA